MDGNIITAVFAPNRTKAQADGLWQWDYGQLLKIVGLTDLPVATEIHFAQRGQSKTVLGVTQEDICFVPIPNSMLQVAAQITAYIYLHTGEDDGETEYEIHISIRARAKPETYDEDDPEIQREYTALVQAIELLSDVNETLEAATQALNDYMAMPLYPSNGR